MSSQQKKKLSMYAVKVFVALFFCTGLLVNCARVGSISGGPKDTLPPVVVKITPGNYAKNFKEKNIYIEFDEYVKLKDLQKEFYTSPAMKNKPSVTLKGKGIRVVIRDTLLDNQTYALNFAGSIVDNNEGNPLKGFRYVFSTGSEIDSMVMSGYTESAFKGDSVSNTFIYFFDAALDSVPAYDSVMFNCTPEAIGRAYGNGIFIAENLKPKDYRIYAYQDVNNNQLYDAGAEMVGFLDSVYNPAHMPEFNAWYDTTRLHLVAEPQLYFRMFTDGRRLRQTLQPPGRPLQHKIMLVFSAPYPEIERLTFSNIDTTKIITEYLKPTRDSIALWLDIPSESLPDTVKGEITYLRHDSLNVLVPYTQEIKLNWRKIESKQQEKDREKFEKEVEKALKEGLEPPKAPNPFKYTFDIPQEVNPEKSVSITFDYPLSRMDSATVELTQGDGEAHRRVPVRLVRDTMNVRQWIITSEWNPGQQYSLFVPPGALVDVAGQSNDSIVRNITIMDPLKYAKLNVDVTGKTPESKYVLQLMTEGGKLIDEMKGVTTGKYTFNYVDVGKVKIMVIEDLNGNGVWDTGNLVERRQPERTEAYMHAPGDPLIETKADWMVDIKIDMNEVFAPITMQQIIEKLQKQEAVRLEKLREEIAKRREQERKNQNQNQGGNAMDMMRGSGLNLPGF